MKKYILIIAVVIVVGCNKDDDPEKYPKPAGCEPEFIRCNSGDVSADVNDDPDQVCKDHGGFKEWVCK